MPVVKCPQCGRETEYEGNEFRPFCSERCKLLDFGAWADERYNIPIESETLTEEDIEKIERASEDEE
ncbi:MAG: DNA gyrase inhibitor YacG [Pyrinomonadaceae bacterium]